MVPCSYFPDVGNKVQKQHYVHEVKNHASRKARTAIQPHSHPKALCTAEHFKLNLDKLT